MNNGMITFEALLEAARQSSGQQVDPKVLEKARKRVADLEERLAQIQTQLGEARRELAELEKQANGYIRKAIEAARALGLEIPEEYQKMTRGGGSNGNGNRSKGKYYWECEGLKPFQAEISRAMWRLSARSGGSAGANGEGVLTVNEFWTLVEKQTGKKELALGEKATVALPNGRTIIFQKIEE